MALTPAKWLKETLKKRLLDFPDQFFHDMEEASPGLSWPILPSERLCSIFNAIYNDDQKKSHTDYIELSMQSQLNKRDL